MGFFHKTLNDAEKMVKHNDLKGALAILEQHDINDLIFKEGLSLLKQVIEDYEKNIRIAIAKLRSFEKYDNETSLANIENAKNSLWKIKEIIKGIIKEDITLM
jgi:hypothetical protein